MKTPLDDHGQPFNRRYNHKRLNDRTIDELIGLAKGIIADEQINTAEAKYLCSWMERNTKYCDDKIIHSMYARIRSMLVDNVLDHSEKEELLILLKSISGEFFPGEEAEHTAASLPLDEPPPEIITENSIFCFTGKFAYGPRRLCQQAVLDLGGIVVNSVTVKTNYLVIGSLCSSDWIHTTYGRKIEHAMDLRENWTGNTKYPISIIHENHWAEYVLR